MIDAEKKKEAKSNFDSYLSQGLLRKEQNNISKEMYIKNAEQSLQLAIDLQSSPLKPYLWIIVISYYSMFYIANAVLLSLGYKVGNKIAHQVTNDALIVLVLDRLKKEMLEEYEQTRNDALEIASIKSDDVIHTYYQELDKRSKFQYNMLEQTKQSLAETSINRAKEFIFEMKKLIR